MCRFDGPNLTGATQAHPPAMDADDSVVFDSPNSPERPGASPTKPGDAPRRDLAATLSAADAAAAASAGSEGAGAAAEVAESAVLSAAVAAVAAAPPKGRAKAKAGAEAKAKALGKGKGAAAALAAMGAPVAKPSLKPAVALGTKVCHYMTQPLVELYGGCMVVLKVS